ncbi:unnamed protein product [Tuber aestivum]|uniref:Uncharacterized protein n=1 Tax=Tuber aestivum TaxID=59557 RepID=A0A292Q0G7_9PEZI|nr:unnamed protein product [Tuber aestivum]
MGKKLILDMGCSYPIAKDLTTLTFYDVAILIDDSDSMISKERGEGEYSLT